MVSVGSGGPQGSSPGLCPAFSPQHLCSLILFGDPLYAHAPVGNHLILIAGLVLGERIPSLSCKQGFQEWLSGGWLSQCFCLFPPSPLSLMPSSALYQLEEFRKRWLSVFSLVVRSSSSYTSTKLWSLDDFWRFTRGKTNFAFTFPQKEQIFS